MGVQNRMIWEGSIREAFMEEMMPELSVKEWIKVNQRKGQKDISIRGRRKSGLGDGIPASLMMPGPELRSQERWVRKLGARSWNKHLSALLGQDTLQGLNLRIAGFPSWVQGEEPFSIQSNAPEPILGVARGGVSPSPSPQYPTTILAALK